MFVEWIWLDCRWTDFQVAHIKKCYMEEVNSEGQPNCCLSVLMMLEASIKMCKYFLRD